MVRKSNARRHTARFGVVALLAMSLVALACGAKGTDESKDDGNSSSSTVASGGSTDKFGTLDSPCGKAPDGKKVTIAAGEDGGASDKLRLGVANERTSDIRPGLLKELYDTGVAFTEWCNEQGGIAGLPIDLVDLDGKLLQTEAAMTTACTGVFAMVGGGWVQDNLAFSGKPESDFHKCKLIAFPGFAVSTEFSEANGVVQPLPNPAYQRSATFWRDLAKKYPEEVKKTTAVFGEIPSIRINKDQNKAVEKTIPAFGFVEDIPYNIASQDWTLVAQKVLQEGATAVNYVGEPENLSNFVAKLKEQNYKGIVYADANQYDEKLFSAGADLAEGVVVRIATHPFEEAADYPAIQQYVDLMKKDPDRKIASLGIQAFSAWLLFATSVNKCVEKSGGEISRTCVIEAAKTIHEWDGGGMHVIADPGAGTPPKCAMGVVAEKGATFGRLFPEKGAKSDEPGFSCYDDAVVDITGDFGKGNVDPSRGY